MKNQSVANRRSAIPPEVSTESRPLMWWEICGPDFDGLLARFEPIGLTEMSAVALQDRTDTKFVLHENRLYGVLETLSDQYRVLQIDGTRLNHYRTLYFDTADFALFQRHHAGGRDRYKVRSRAYVDSRLSFLEVKHKTGRNRTVKNRIPTFDFLTELDDQVDPFLANYLPLAPDLLEPKLWNEYTRVTLVGRRDPERVTLDLNLQFRSGDRTALLPGVAIVEVKQESVNRESAFMRRMRALNERPTGLSKYCAGVSLLHDQVKHNRFKPNLRLLNQVIQGGYHV